MKYIICYTLAFILMIPAIFLGCLTWLWKPNKRGFLNGSQWLDEQFNYGKFIDNLLDK